MTNLTFASSIEHPDDESPTFTIVNGSDGAGSLLVFHNAVLARAEVNKNRDEITEAGIAEIAGSIAGRPIDVEHDRSRNVGMFTAGRASKDGKAALVDGAVWIDRYPDVAQRIIDGGYDLSIEADVATAICSVCGGSFNSSKTYCDHLSNRKALASVRKLDGLSSRGGALTSHPAGTKTKFDDNSIYVMASHEEPVNASTVSPEQGKENGMDPEELKKQLEAALAKVTSLEASVAQLKEEADKKVSTLQASYDDSQKTISDLRATVRRAKIGDLMTDEDWKTEQSVFASMSDETFDVVLKRMTPKAKTAKDPDEDADPDDADDKKPAALRINASVPETGFGKLVAG